MHSASFSLQNVLEKMSEQHRTRAREQGTQIDYSIAPGAPGDLTGDHVSLSQILDELVGNAVEHTRGGRVTAEVEPLDGEVVRDDGSVTLRFAVKDSGDGMTGEQVLALHQLFMHSDASEAVNLGVAGPGLTLCKKLINVMGGAISVESEPDRGATFAFTAVFSVPEEPEDDTGAAETADEAGEGDGFRLPAGMELLRNARVLLVEDNPVNQTLTRDLLSYAGFRVDLVENGEEAVRAVQDASEAYAAIFMDVQMPVMDGLEATRRIRADGNRVPIIATSANTQVEEKDRCLAAGADDCLPKPFHIPDFYATILRWVRPVAGDASDPSPPEETPVLRESGPEIELPERIDGIDMASGLSRVMGNRALFGKLLTDFAQANLDVAKKIDDALSCADVAAAAFLLHGLKSTAGNIGAEELYRATIELESALETQSEDIAARLEAVRSELDGVVAAILSAAIPEMRSAVERMAGDAPFDLATAQRLAEGLREMLEDQDLAAQEQLDRLAEILGGRGYDKSLERLEASVEALEFAEAREILERVCQELAN